MFNKSMKWLVAYVTAIASSVLSAVIMGFLFHGLNKPTAMFSLLIGVGVSVSTLIKNPKLSSRIDRKDFGFWSWATIIFFTIFSLRAFLWLVFKRGDNFHILFPSNVGDIPFHVNYIKYFANGIDFWPDNPILTGDKVRYHFGMDLFNSLLVLSGVNIIQSLIWVGLLGSITTAVALITWGRAFALAGFLFSGGLAGFQFFQNFNFADYQGMLDWKSPFIAMFVPQRGFLFALPAGLLLLNSWRERYFRSNTTSKNYNLSLPLWVEVLLYSSMPLFHIHTFIFLSAMLGIWFLILPKNKCNDIVNLIKFSFFPSYFLIYFLTDFFKKSSMIHLDLSYIKSLDGFLHYWVFNFGIFWFLILWLCFKVVKFHKSNETYSSFSTSEGGAFVLPAVILFILFSFIIMSGWKYDNAKFLLWSYLILLPYLWENLLTNWDKFSTYVVCISLFFSGFICIVGTLNNIHSPSVFKISELKEVEEATRHIPVKYRFATSPTWNHPIFFFGRKVVLGYPGWLWVHGFNAQEREAKLKRLMLGENNWKELAKELGVRYIFWGNQEQKEYHLSLKPWETDAVKIFTGNYCQIYDLGQ